MNRIKEINRVFLVTILIYIVTGFVNGWILSKTGSYNWVIIISQIMVILPSLVYIGWKKINMAEAIRFNKISLGNIVLIIIFAYLITPLMSLINGLSMIYVKNNTAIVMTEIAENNSIYISLLLIAIIPAIFEEVVYRGLVYNTYRKERIFAGIILSGFLFGVMHTNINQFSYAFVMGVIFALLIEATDSILSTIIVHCVINGSSIVMLYLYPLLLKVLEALYGQEGFSAANIAEQVERAGEELSVGILLRTYGISALICTVLAFIVYRVIAKNAGRWEHIKDIFRKKDNEKRKSLLTPSLIIAILLCIALMVIEEMSGNQEIGSKIDGSLIIMKNWFLVR